MPTCVVDSYILPPQKIVSHKKYKSSETDVLVSEVWADCTEVSLDRMYWGLVGQNLLRFGWTE
jgi:hypothetical protein